MNPIKRFLARLRRKPVATPKAAPPIDKLVTQYNEWAAAQKDESDANAQG